VALSALRQLRREWNWRRRRDGFVVSIAFDDLLDQRVE
jgi:hypothetical protein